MQDALEYVGMLLLRLIFNDPRIIAKSTGHTGKAPIVFAVALVFRQGLRLSVVSKRTFLIP